MSIPRPLLRRSPLLPNESLPSLVARLAQLNGYEPPTLLDRYCLMGIPPAQCRGTVDCWPPAAVFPRLAALTTIAVAVLHRASAHRFTPILTLPSAADPADPVGQDKPLPLLDGPVMLAHIRPPHAAQFCPRCLEDSVYHRLTWTPVAIAACLEHHCLLVQQCPNCQRPISIAMVTVARCHACGTDLRRAGMRDLAEAPWVVRAQEVIQAWLTLAPVPDTTGVTFPDPRAMVCYGVLDVVRRLVMRSSAAWWYRYSIPDGATKQSMGRTLLEGTPRQIVSLYATAMQAISAWPESFYVFLRTYRLAQAEAPDPALGGEGYDDGRVLLWIMAHWIHPVYARVRDGLEHYLRTECRLWEWGDGGRAMILQVFHELCADALSRSAAGVS
ncbi:MAG TPA: TniQ family protein [Herpetosiphonaceae bacterium]|nr:TniQ family protein [Herpetosiphonaceae bacterium]